MRGNFRGEVLHKNYLFSDSSIFLSIVIFFVVSAGQITNGYNFFTHSYSENYSNIHHQIHPKRLLAENTFNGDLAKHASLFPNTDTSNASLSSYPPALPSMEATSGPCVF